MLYKVGLVFATQHHESVMTIIYHFNENLGNATRSVWALTGYKGTKLEKANLHVFLSTCKIVSFHSDVSDTTSYFYLFSVI